MEWPLIQIVLLTLVAWACFHLGRKGARENGWRKAVKTLAMTAVIFAIIRAVTMGEHFESNEDGDPIRGGDTGHYVTDYVPTTQQRTERALQVFLFIFVAGGVGIAWSVAERTEKLRPAEPQKSPRTSYPEMRARVVAAVAVCEHRDELYALDDPELAIHDLTINALGARGNMWVRRREAIMTPDERAHKWAEALTDEERARWLAHLAAKTDKQRAEIDDAMRYAEVEIEREIDHRIFWQKWFGQYVDRLGEHAGWVIVVAVFIALFVLVSIPATQGLAGVLFLLGYFWLAYIGFTRMR